VFIVSGQPVMVRAATPVAARLAPASLSPAPGIGLVTVTGGSTLDLTLDAPGVSLGGFTVSESSVPAVADLPPDAVAERESLEAQGIRAMLHVPVMRGGELQGLVGVDDPDFDPLEWTDFAGLMSLLADALAAVFDETSVSELFGGENQS
jgi:GAF domain-containing protein